MHFCLLRVWKHEASAMVKRPELSLQWAIYNQDMCAASALAFSLCKRCERQSRRSDGGVFGGTCLI